MDLLEDPETSTITCQLEVPGMKKEDVSLLVRDGQLTISGERRPTLPGNENEQQPAQFLVRELKYGKFQREVSLPPHLGVRLLLSFLSSSADL
jgi:HSP20 family protein